MTTYTSSSSQLVFQADKAVRKHRIAVIGAGTAGAAAALFLNQGGHQVTVFEKVQQPGMAGAGIMIQPSGLKILQVLGLDQTVKSLGVEIKQFYGHTFDKQVINLDFANEYGVYGLGLHRGVLFTVLFDALRNSGVNTIDGIEITKINQSSDGITKELIDQHGNKHGGFDLVVVANGSSSKLREGLPITLRSERQEWAAAWVRLPMLSSTDLHSIHQYYHGCSKMLGFMPIGCLPNNQEASFINLFWSIRFDKVDEWRTAGVDTWRRDAIKMAPSWKSVLEQVEHLDQMVVAPYYDVKLSQLYHNNVVFIGDSAHAMSPQLSYGTSSALLDAYMLSKALNVQPSILKGLSVFNEERITQNHYYHTMSKLVTPFFQSDYQRLAWVRDHLFKYVCKYAPTKNVVNNTLLGIRKSWFSNLDKTLIS